MADGGASADGTAEGRIVYGETLRLDALLNLQGVIASGGDDLFFIVLHQSHELWFKELLYELERARDHITVDALESAIGQLRRIRAIEELLTAQLFSMMTLSVEGFAALRERLGTSSAFQSAQFREIEFLSGLKDPRYLSGDWFTPAERTRLRQRYCEPSIRSAFDDLLARRGVDDLFASLRREPEGELRGIVEGLVAHDEGLQGWRTRHVEMAARLIGDSAGTGGTSGIPYLRSRRETAAFPELRAVLDRL
ncbi:tryptophan 2,3-dioxygenase family protein [Actinomadura nitritigenes]|uniref:tryptophan 2,3-dioxygenase family protein n=1 Tax=Actinomadura nitritigenes TaxID=134602 RepID=UPI0036CA6A53